MAGEGVKRRAGVSVTAERVKRLLAERGPMTAVEITAEMGWRPEGNLQRAITEGEIVKGYVKTGGMGRPRVIYRLPGQDDGLIEGDVVWLARL